MRSRSAALELVLLTALIMAALMILFAWLSLRWQRASWLAEVQRGLVLASDTLQSNLRDRMMENRRDQISNVIERVSRDTLIKQIQLINHQGVVKLSTMSAAVGSKIEMSSPPCTICHTDARKTAVTSLAVGTRTSLDGDFMHAFTPILAEQGCITQACHRQDAESGVLGVMDLSLSLQGMNEALAQTQLKMRLASLATILLGGGLLWLALAYRFRRPMSDLLRGFSRVAEGDLTHPVPTRTHDEFGQLAESFNVMSRQLAAVQQRLIQSERLISMGRLAAGVAHEINNPLSGILSYAEDLLEDAEPGDPHRKDYEVIVRETLRCRRIVRSLLDFARQDEPKLARAHPRMLIERALDVLERQATFRNIRFTREVEENLPPIEVDSLQIEQVFVNLLVNAQQAMPKGGTIAVGARSEGNGREVKFYVRDEGMGIAAEIRSQIFDPFFSTKGGETDGLGLSICLGIIQNHGGTIDFESEEGGGTTFWFVLPVQQRKESGEGGIDERENSGRG